MHIDKPFYYERAICMFKNIDCISYGKEKEEEIEKE